MPRPKISVLIALYNHERYIRSTLEGALAQTLPPDEIVVMDDASTDASVEVARSVPHPSIRILAETRNLGGPNTMLGLKACTGEYVAILNSDDCWAPDKLEKQVAHLERHPECGAVFTHTRVIDEMDVPWTDGTSRHAQVFNVPNRSRTAWLNYLFHRGNTFCASSALVRRCCFDLLGGLDGRYIQMQDFDMWLRIALGGWDLHLIEEPLTLYRVSRVGANMSSGGQGERAIHSFEFAKALRGFWKSNKLELLAEIFPNLDIPAGADDSLSLFYLARYAAKLDSLPHRILAVETMHQWGGDISAMRLAYDLHGFTHKDYRNFIAANPFGKLSSMGLKGQLRNLTERFLPYHAQQWIKARLRR
jgi:glycosyltransferase involved in cell wall biosynthesis